MRTDSTQQYERARPVPQPPSNRVFDLSLQEQPKKIPIRGQPSNWCSMLSRTSGEESICSNNPRVSKSKSFQSSVFTKYNDRDYRTNQKRISKPTENSSYSTTSQIVALPGCVKRDKYSIRDDQKFYNKQNIGFLYKMQKDYNCDVIEGRLRNAEESQNFNFAERRYGGSYKDKNNSQIFNNAPKENDDSMRKTGKKTFYGTNVFKSQIELK